MLLLILMLILTKDKLTVVKDTSNKRILFRMSGNLGNKKCFYTSLSLSLFKNILR